MQQRYRLHAPVAAAAGAANSTRTPTHWKRTVARRVGALQPCIRSWRLTASGAGLPRTYDMHDTSKSLASAVAVAAAEAEAAAAGGSADSPGGHRSGVVIVGGGPAGYASAMMLARRGWTDITLVEAQADPTYADPDRSYVYRIDGRGRKWLEPAGLVPALQAASVSTVNLTVNRVTTTGKVRQSTMSIGCASNWLPRTALMKLLVEGLEADPVVRAAVRVATCTRAADYQLGPDGRIAVTLQPLEVSSRGGGAAGKGPVVAAAGVVMAPDGSTETQAPAAAAAAAAAAAEEPRQVLYPRLLVACDGFRSSVRAALCSWSPGSYNSATFHSLSTGLRYKVLTLPPNPVTKEGVVLSNPTIAVLEGAPIPRLAGGNPLRMGLLPVRDPGAPRTGNINLLPDHPFWDIMEAEEMYEVLGESFHQMDWRALVPYEVMARFAASRGGTFPAPQYTTHLSWTPDQASDAPLEHQAQRQQGAKPNEPEPKGSGTSVVLVGDAAHSFPPDLGQGVNSALEDVVVLQGALEAAGDDPAAAANLYQERRLQDAAALAQLMQVGYPLQYKQYKLRERLFFVGIIVQLLLSKVLPWLVEPPIAMLIQDPARSYSDIWAGAQRTATVLRVVAAAAAAGVAVLVGRVLLTGTVA